MDINPIEVQKHLGGVDYPATTEELVQSASENAAPPEIVSALEAMDKEEFDGPSAVQEALA
jgi:Protein of unknown function (DUF2795)